MILNGTADDGAGTRILVETQSDLVRPNSIHQSEALGCLLVRPACEAQAPSFASANPDSGQATRAHKYLLLAVQTCNCEI